MTFILIDLLGIKIFISAVVCVVCVRCIWVYVTNLVSVLVLRDDLVCDGDYGTILIS